jgi:hypothetical protein
MKKIGQIMSELGFNENASEDVKRAFVKNLIKAAAEQEDLAHRQMGVFTLKNDLDNTQNLECTSEVELDYNENIDSFEVDTLENIQKSMKNYKNGTQNIKEVQLSLFEQIDKAQGKKSS